MRKNKKRKYSLLLLLLVLGVTVGYAFLSTTLNINGTTKVKNATWNIYWDNPVVSEGSISSVVPTIDTNKTTASFNVTLNNPGDFYEFTIDAKNDGTIDGMISAISYKLNNVEISEENKLPAYLNYTVTYSDDVAINTNHLLKANTKETYKVRVEFKKDIENTDLPGEEVDLDLKFAVTYVQADSNATETHPVSAITYLNRQVDGQITPGDLIGIGETEDFYVISSDSNKTVLLAKYNLLVGSVYENWSGVGYIESDTPGYGLQSVDAHGYSHGDGTFKGTVAFSSTNYWMNENTLISPYNENDTIYYDNSSNYDGDWRFKYRLNDSNANAYVYNSALITAPDFSGECNYTTNCYYTPGYSIAYYVEGYKNRLIEMGAPSTITGRLLTYEEAVASKSVKDNNVSIIFDGEQNYWLGSSSGKDGVMYVDDNDTDINSYGFSYNDDFYGGGVRPVIEIPTSELQ